MKFLMTLITLLLLLNTGQAKALETKTVYQQSAQGLNDRSVDLKVWPGYGLTINFIPTGEVIKDMWIGDPSRIAIGSNGNLCPKEEAQQENCTGATVLFIRQIQPISFPNLTSSSDGSTQLIVITASSEGEKQYQFKLSPATGQPDYSSIVIKPDPNNPAQHPLANNNRNEVVATKTVSNNNFTTNNVQPSRPHEWKQIRLAVSLMRQGKSKQEVIARSGISESNFNWLINLGYSK